MADALDWGKLNLERMTASVDAQVKLMKAYADYNYRMMEVLEKRIKIETDILKLRVMIDAFKDFKRARSALLREIRTAEGRIARTDTNLKYMRYLQRGETLPAQLVAMVWIGFNFFLNNLPVEDEMEVASLAVTDEHRRGQYFAHNLHPEESCENAPESTCHVRGLIEFLREKNYVPRLGSPPYYLLLQVIAVLTQNAEDRIRIFQDRIATIQPRLEELRTGDWRTISIDLDPKDVADTDEDSPT
jgi:hypothetical protein